MASPVATLDAAPLRELLERLVAGGLRVYRDAPTVARQVCGILSGEYGRVTLERADRILCALNLPGELNRLYPPEPKVGRAGYTWPKPHPCRRISDEQLRAAHVLHLAGMSARELGRRLYERLGYASPKSCTKGILAGWRRLGLERRDRVEATVAASTMHGQGSRDDRAAYKRWHCAEVRAGRRDPWPSDLAQAKHGRRRPEPAA